MSDNKFNSRSNVARSGRQYRNSWMNHVSEFTSVLYEAGIPASEWNGILDPLRGAVEKATLSVEAHLEEKKHASTS